jgi:hypothetical protein
MEKLSDEKLIDLKFVLDNSDVIITHHNSDQISMRDVVCDSLEIRKELEQLRADAETSQNHNAAVIDPLIAQLRDAGFTGTLSEMVGQACEVREATRWIPVGEGVIPMDILLEIGNTKTGIVDVAVYGSISWQVREPTHYRLPVPPEGGTK